MSINLFLFLYFLASTALTEAQVFDVTKYGAKGDGSTDSTQALTSAWKEACAAAGSSTIVFPSGTFALGLIKLEGPCKGSMTLQVQGTLKAPEDPSKVNGDGWITINNLNQFTMSGGGTLDGQGKIAWTQNDCHKNKDCDILPMNLRLNSLTNSLIQNITTLDSKNFHVNVIGCKNLTFEHFNISAPENAPNTDGIHMGRSNGINIINTDIKTGDDCISIGDGSENVNITNVTCGPGHGISVGSLGRYKQEQPVAGIFVKNCTITKTQNGIRIKTWPKSEPGTATDMHFEDIVMDGVGNPVLIDQAYCPWNQCSADVPSSVKISKVSFKNIRGTSSTQVAVKLVCSKSLPCENVEVADVDLSYSGPEGAAISVCSDIQPTITGKQNPPICSNTTAKAS